MADIITSDGTPAQTHFHCCECCAHVWCHETLKGATKQQNDDYHRCPKCGSGPYRFGVDTRREADELKRLLASVGNE